MSGVFFYWAQAVSDRWALELFSTAKKVGLYAVLFQLGYYPISLAVALATNFLGPIFFQRAGTGNDEKRNADTARLGWRLTWYALGLTSLAFVVALLLHRQIFMIFVGREYASASGMLPWIVLAGGIFAAGQCLTLNLLSTMKTRSMLNPKVFTALIGLALNFIGAYWFGLDGVVLANVAFSVVYFLWMFALHQRTTVRG